MDNDKLVRLFVYGTLKRGKPLYASYRFAEHAKFVGEDSVKGELHNISWFPGLYEDGNNDVKGELFDVPEKLYNIIKNMEENAGYVAKDVITKAGEKAKIFYYTIGTHRTKESLIKEF